VMATSPNFYNVSRPVALKPTLVVEWSTASSSEAAAKQAAASPFASATVAWARQWPGCEPRTRTS